MDADTHTQIAESTNGSAARDVKSWSFVWLVTTAGMTVMEVSVVTFLSQGEHTHTHTHEHSYTHLHMTMIRHTRSDLR